MKAFESLDSILGNVATNKDIPKDSKPNNGLNIKDVVVPDSLVESVLNFNRKIPHVEEVVEEVEPEDQPRVDEAAIVSKVSSLVSKLSSLLQEAKMVIAEMTSCGMIGTNQKFVLGKKAKKNGPVKTNKRNKS